jgi:hypothetical protein
MSNLVNIRMIKMKNKKKVTTSCGQKRKQRVNSTYSERELRSRESNCTPSLNRHPKPCQIQKFKCDLNQR